MKIIAVTNRKGGVGKSTIATHIAAGLAAKGLRVGLVDTDSQGHAGLMLGMPESNGLYNVMVNHHSLEDELVIVPAEKYSGDPSNGGALWLLPSSGMTYKIPFELQEQDAFAFLETMERFGDLHGLDVILVDTNPTMSMFDASVLTATDGFIYVTEAEKMSFDGVTDALAQMRRFERTRKKYLNRDTRIVGIVPNKLRPSTVVHRENLRELATHFGDLVWTPLMLSVNWVMASQLQEPVFISAPDTDAARDAWRMVERTRKAVESWQTTSVTG